MTYQKCYEEGCKALEAAGVEAAALDARLLLEFVCKTERHDLLAHGDREVDLPQAERYKAFVEKRSRRIPLQYLIGVQEFMGLEFVVGSQVLIPRQDTEILVEEVLRELQDGSRILDMCTGSGCILLSLLHYANGCEGVGADISQKALELARTNAERLGLLKEKAAQGDEPDAEPGASFIQSDLFEKVEGRFEIIVSNPPYIKSDVIPTLMPEVRDYEPLSALDGGGDGLMFYRKIVAESPGYLKGGGRLYLEIGHDQAPAVRGLMRRRGFLHVQVIKDYAGLDRVLCGIWP